MAMMLRILLVLMIALVIGGRSKRFIGEYHYSSKHLVIKLTLYKDSSFVYREYDEVSTESFTIGFWKIRKDTLYLTSQNYNKADSLKTKLLGGNFFKLVRLPMVVRKNQLFQPESQIVLNKVRALTVKR